MLEILTDYHVNNRTIALIPAKHTDYDTIVMECDCKKFVKKSPFQIIQRSCLERGSTYDGVRMAVMYQTGVKRKVPIPINLMKNIHTFPTQSPSQFECKWIFYNHVLLIKPTHSNSTYKSIITFKNLQEIPMHETYYVLEKQMHRTAISMHAFATD